MAEDDTGDTKTRKRDNDEQQHPKYVYKFSVMGTGKEKKTWREDISRLLLKKIQNFPQQQR